MESEALLLQQGVDLMLYGMSTVFVFLGLLVAATSIMSRIILWLQPPPSVAAKPPNNTRHIAVISAALAHHRRIRRAEKRP